MLLWVDVLGLFVADTNTVQQPDCRDCTHPPPLCDPAPIAWVLATTTKPSWALVSATFARRLPKGCWNFRFPTALFSCLPCLLFVRLDRVCSLCPKAFGGCNSNKIFNSLAWAVAWNTFSHNQSPKSTLQPSASFPSSVMVPFWAPGIINENAIPVKNAPCLPRACRSRSPSCKLCGACFEAQDQTPSRQRNKKQTHPTEVRFNFGDGRAKYGRTICKWSTSTLLETETLWIISHYDNLFWIKLESMGWDRVFLSI